MIDDFASPFLAAGPSPRSPFRGAHGAGAAEVGTTVVQQFILKIHSRCDLRCDYCYVYTMADQSWRSRPRVMARGVVEATAQRIAEHARRKGLTSVDVILHGGEPLLAGHDHIAATVRSLRRWAGSDVRVGVVLQTNGVRLDDTYLQLFDALDVRVAVSVDGTAEMHDRHRRRPDGGGSHASVAEALTRLGATPYRHLFNGLLCTIDLGNDPVTTYESLLAFQPPVVDFLLPHGNWSTPPPRHPDRRDAPAPYGTWLAAVFDRWYSAPRAETDVRVLADIVNLLLGGRSRVEGVGMSPASAVVIETDGTVELSDSFKAVGEGAAATGHSVTSDSFSFDRLPVPPSIAGFTLDGPSLSQPCGSCPVVGVCGGGLYAHRFEQSSGYENPSVYCDDLYRLISHIRSRLASDIGPLLRTTR